MRHLSYPLERVPHASSAASPGMCSRITPNPTLNPKPGMCGIGRRGGPGAWCRSAAVASPCCSRRRCGDATRSFCGP